ncbi:hypothetical protein LOK49_LG13G02365 [Camellia lanceoleosa]|uniref:Uncharacterized protein n=1 Tax=Camellia lanceoleosa TaxID=1840588 RepID=A0ACC0FKM4_9ERIC|nr:hypothetical protein LOK49_LG13G02365 [Camellia lanceoleosa]
MSMSFLRDQIIGIVRRFKADDGVGVVKTVVPDHHWNVDDDDNHDVSSLGLRGGGGRRRRSEIRVTRGFLDASAHKKLHRMLVTNLSKCTLFLVRELTCFNKDLLCEVCSATFADEMENGFSINIFSLYCRLGCYGSSQSAILGEATINLLIMLMH